MVQRGQQLRFPFEARPPLFTFQEISLDDLARDVATEARVPGPIHLPHPSRSKRREDLVRPETGARGSTGFKMLRHFIRCRSDPPVDESLRSDIVLPEQGSSLVCRRFE
jgi:hypothetical protein